MPCTLLITISISILPSTTILFIIISPAPLIPVTISISILIIFISSSSAVIPFIIFIVSISTSSAVIPSIIFIISVSSSSAIISSIIFIIPISAPISSISVSVPIIFLNLLTLLLPCLRFYLIPKLLGPVPIVCDGQSLELGLAVDSLFLLFQILRLGRENRVNNSEERSDKVIRHFRTILLQFRVKFLNILR
ncbi:hypothetical protein V8G54_036553 [Vigna mungo]|uniref:Uncharacterized protein n=1 Tax=Vigna mungo TaxID=3915 RepID=A0AAQ3MHE5_VIGMU